MFTRRRWLTLVVLCVLVPAVLPLTSAAQFEDVRERIQKALVEQGVPSLAVAVARNGKIIWEEGFGWADRENRIPTTEHTMYSLASISKPITATGLMVLVERGKIDLDRPINDYLGAAKLQARVGDAAQAAVRRVANHTAGLPLHYQFFYEDEPYRRPGMDETIRRYGNLVTAPGERFQYSNLGYGILDYIIARVAGESYEDFVRKEVFIPLGLTHMSVGIGPGLEKHHAIRYGPDGLPIPFYDFDHRGASAVYSSAHDLVRFGMFHLKNHLPDQKQILSDKAIEAMQQPTAKTGTEAEAGYGIGWGTRVTKKGFRVVSHSGGMGGVSTTLILVPSENVAVVVLSNSASRVPAQIARAILVALGLDEPPTKEEEERKPPTPPLFQPTPELLGTWSGKVYTYKGELPIKLWIKESGDVHAQLSEQLKALVNDVSFRDGFLRGRLLGDVGTEDANRRPYVLALEVKLRERALTGSLIAMSTPGRRTGNALTHWVELKKE